MVCSWNVGAAKAEGLGDNTHGGNVAGNRSFLEDLVKSAAGKGQSGPESVVFGLQEVVDLDNRTVTASMSLFSFFLDAGADVSQKPYSRPRTRAARLSLQASPKPNRKSPRVTVHGKTRSRVHSHARSQVHRMPSLRYTSSSDCSASLLSGATR